MDTFARIQNVTVLLCLVFNLDKLRRRPLFGHRLYHRERPSLFPSDAHRALQGIDRAYTKKSRVGSAMVVEEDHQADTETTTVKKKEAFFRSPGGNSLLLA